MAIVGSWLGGVRHGVESDKVWLGAAWYPTHKHHASQIKRGLARAPLFLGLADKDD